MAGMPGELFDEVQQHPATVQPDRRELVEVTDALEDHPVVGDHLLVQRSYRVDGVGRRDLQLRIIGWRPQAGHIPTGDLELEPPSLDERDVLHDRQQAEVAGQRTLLPLLVGQPVELAQERGPLLFEEDPKAGELVVPKYLTMVHMAGLVHGPILIAVGFALTTSTMTAWLNTTAAVMLATASALLLVKDTLNWRQGITDEIAEKSLGLKVGRVFGPLFLVGMGLATAGVISGI